MQSEFKLFEEKTKFSNIEELKKEIILLAKNIDFTEVINKHLEKIVEDKYFIPFNTSENRVLLYATEKFELSLIHIPPKEHTIKNGVMYSYTNDIFFCPLIDTYNYKINIYEQTHTEDSSLINEDYILVPKQTKILKKYDILFLRKFKDILKLEKEKPFLCLSYLSKENILDYSWEYNADTLRPTRIASINVNNERINIISDVLSMIGNNESIPGLIELCYHNSHSIRWKAVNALINVDFNKGIEMIKTMTNDNHIEVREAAEASLKFLKNYPKNGH